jgi:hypothetical protein
VCAPRQASGGVPAFSEPLGKIHLEVHASSPQLKGFTAAKWADSMQLTLRSPRHAVCGPLAPPHFHACTLFPRSPLNQARCDGPRPAWFHQYNVKGQA